MNWVLQQHQYVWNTENNFLDYLRRKLPIITSGGTGITTFTTTGTSGAATWDSGTGTLNIPTYASAQSWDQTLAVSNITTRNFEQDQAILGTPQYYQTFKPANYNGTTIGLYNSWVDDSFINADTRRDVVMSWHSYNYTTGGARISTSDAAFAFKSEQYYLQDGTNLMEFHLPEMITTTGTSHRTWSFYIHRPTGFAYMQAQTDHISFNRYFNNYTYFDVSSGTSEAGGGTAGSISMLLDATGAGAGMYSRFQMVDGIGTSIFLSINDGQFNITSGGLDTIVTTQRTIYMPAYVQFSTNNYFSDAQVYLQSQSGASGKGFNFYTVSQGALYYQMLVGNNISWQPTAHALATRLEDRVTIMKGAYAASGARFQIAASATTAAQINLLPGGGAPTSPIDGDIWFETNVNTGFKIRINGVTKTVTVT